MNYAILHSDVLDALRGMDTESVQCVVTSPPYWGLRDYKCDGQIGLEKTPQDYVDKMVAVFAEVRRVLRKDGTVWLNLGDSYAGSWGNYGGQNRGNGSQREIKRGSRVDNKAYAGTEKAVPPTAKCGGELKPKDLIGIPWRVALALQADGWYLRSDIIWGKPNTMPESVKDRPTRSHEYIFLLSKSAKYYYDADAIKEPAKQVSIDRINQSSFNEQNGGEKDYGSDSNRNSRKTLENFKGSFFGGRNKHAGIDSRKHSGNKDNGAYIANGVNKRDVWTVPPAQFRDAHFATFPTKLIEPCILAGSKPGDTVLDPFCGSGTTLEVSIQHGRIGLGIEINPDYIKIAHRRLAKALPLLAVNQ